MNIFVLDENPIIAAQMLCDKHTVKMPLETAQLLSSVFSIALKTPNPLVSITDQNIEIPYKLTHKNHPCSLWPTRHVIFLIHCCNIPFEILHLSTILQKYFTTASATFLQCFNVHNHFKCNLAKRFQQYFGNIFK